jgi:hypothetical protein
MLCPARPDRDTEDDTRKMKGIVVECRNYQRDVGSTCVEVGLCINCTNNIGLMQPVENGIDVLSKVPV